MAGYGAEDCPKCRAPLSRADRVCPFCYTRVYKPWDGKHAAGTIFVLLLVGLILAALSDWTQGTDYFHAVRTLFAK